MHISLLFMYVSIRSFTNDSALLVNKLNPYKIYIIIVFIIQNKLGIINLMDVLDTCW